MTSGYRHSHLFNCAEHLEDDFWTRTIGTTANLEDTPTPRGTALLGGKEIGVAQGNLVDLLTHCWRIWDQVTAWSANFPRARSVVALSHSRISGRLNDWGRQDPIYKSMVEQRPNMASG